MKFQASFAPGVVPPPNHSGWTLRLLNSAGRQSPFGDSLRLNYEGRDLFLCSSIVARNERRLSNGLSAAVGRPWAKRGGFRSEPLQGALKVEIGLAPDHSGGRLSEVLPNLQFSIDQGDVNAKKTARSQTNDPPARSVSAGRPAGRSAG